MTEYEQQAQDFLKETGATIEARYVALKEHFPGDGENRDAYEIRIKRGQREYVTMFGTSIQDTEERIASLLSRVNNWQAENIRKGRRANDYLYVRKVKQWTADASEWKQAGEGTRPTAYDVLAALTWYEPEGNVDDFAAEYGYTKPSEALRVFEAVRKEWQAIQSLFTDAEIEKGAEIV